MTESKTPVPESGKFAVPAPVPATAYHPQPEHDQGSRQQQAKMRATQPYSHPTQGTRNRWRAFGARSTQQQTASTRNRDGNSRCAHLHYLCGRAVTRDIVILVAATCSPVDTATEGCGTTRPRRSLLILVKGNRRRGLQPPSHSRNMAAIYDTPATA